MQKINPDIVRLTDILQAITDIEDYKITVLSIKKDIHAVCYNIAIIGEAASRLSEELTTLHTEISWSQIIGIRHKIIHDYGRVDVVVLQDVVSQKLPELKTQINNLLHDLSAGNAP